MLHVALRKAAAQCSAFAGGHLQRKVGLRRWRRRRRGWRGMLAVAAGYGTGGVYRDLLCTAGMSCGVG
jgi:hypothetical protein